MCACGCLSDAFVWQLAAAAQRGLQIVKSLIFPTTRASAGSADSGEHKQPHQVAEENAPQGFAAAAGASTAPKC